MQIINEIKESLLQSNTQETGKTPTKTTTLKYLLFQKLDKEQISVK
jgi:hypothetical protein